MPFDGRTACLPRKIRKTSKNPSFYVAAMEPHPFGFANYTGVPLYLASPNGILSELEPMLATPTYLPNGHVPVFEPTRIIGRLPNDVWSPLPLPH